MYDENGSLFVISGLLDFLSAEFSLKEKSKTDKKGTKWFLEHQRSISLSIFKSLNQKAIKFLLMRRFADPRNDLLKTGGHQYSDTLLGSDYSCGT